MEEVIAQFVSILTALGLPGFIIAVLIYRDNQHTKRNNELVDKLIELGNKYSENSATNIAAINSLNQTIMLSRNGAG